ncbi:MAG: minor capsid protein [Rhizobiales bacterium]|nr:minor capsid protein [Hyphomicrobiales bacterium]
MAVKLEARPFAEAVAALQARSGSQVDSWHWTDLWQQEHAKSFTVAKSAGFDILTDVYSGLETALKEGRTGRQFAQELEPLLVRKGWWGRQDVVDPETGDTSTVQLGSLRRLQTIFDANMRVSYAAGHWARFERTKDTRPWLRYVAVMDGRARPEHAARHNLCLRVDDPYWDVWAPPCGFGCRCTLQSLSDRDVARMRGQLKFKPPPDRMRSWTNSRTGEVIQIPEGIDPGWAYNPGKAGANQLPPAPTTWTPPPPKPAAPPPPPPLPFHLRMERTSSYLPKADLAGMPAGVADWHQGAWPYVDDVMRRAILAKGPPTILPPEKSGAYATFRGGIMMARSYTRASKEERSVTWRHEFGHYLDFYPDRPATYLPVEVRSVRAIPQMQQTLERWNAARAADQPDDALPRGADRATAEAYWRKHGISGLTLDDMIALAGSEGDPAPLLNAVRQGDPQAFLKAWRPRSPSELRLQLMVSDFIEAVSKCTMGGKDFGTGGHGRAYYAAVPLITAGYTGRHAVEAFANWVTVRSGALQQVKVILARLAPEVVEAFEVLLKEMAGG